MDFFLSHSFFHPHSFFLPLSRSLFLSPIFITLQLNNHCININLDGGDMFWMLIVIWMWDVRCGNVMWKWNNNKTNNKNIMQNHNNMHTYLVIRMHIYSRARGRAEISLVVFVNIRMLMFGVSRYLFLRDKSILLIWCVCWNQCWCVWGVGLVGVDMFVCKGGVSNFLCLISNNPCV